VTALIFDLDGTLVDSVYLQTTAWQHALASVDVDIDSAALHRRIGMDGELLMQESARDVGRQLSKQRMKAAVALHAKYFARLAAPPRPMSGAIELLRRLKKARVPHGIATSGKKESIAPSLQALKIDKSLVVIDGSSARQAKPAPDLFLKCARRLGVAKTDCFVVGDAVWDVLAAGRAQMSAIGLMCGGYGETELYRAGAIRVYRNPADLLTYLHQLGIHL
jgi:HAD superfamily hydrolase (TIGR01549 family)